MHKSLRQLSVLESAVQRAGSARLEVVAQPIAGAMHVPTLSPSSRLSSSPAGTMPEARASDPAAQAAGTAGAVPLTAPATNYLPASNADAAVSCIRSEDGTVIAFDERTGKAVSGATKAGGRDEARSQQTTRRLTGFRA
ncbi:hypothetical protein NKH81_12905 [Mesorhizobium sp. M0959]|uniref:hypothetical protein n=2 Tax=Mesorhizobium TaxID=68287 RepID=UPI003336513D